MSFEGDLKKFRLTAGANIFDLKKAVGIKLFSAIVADTPVGTSDPKRNYTGGRLRNNWLFFNNDDSSKTLRGTDRSGAKAILRITTGINNSKMSDSLILVNNLPYGPPIEFDGHSKTKAPGGMVRKNVIRFQRLVEQQARRISRR